MKAQQRVLLILLMLCLMVTSVVGCTKDKPDSTTDSETETIEPGLMDRYVKGLYPDNKEFHVYSPEGLYTTASMDGTDVEVAIYERDALISEYFGIDIIYSEFYNGENERLESMRLAAMSGDAEHNIFVSTAQTLTKLAVEGLLEDLNSVEHLDLSNIWWSQKFNEGCTLKGSQFVAAGPFSPLYYHGALCLVMNNQLAEDYGIPDVVQMVKNGTWTNEEMYNILTKYGVTDDFNGDGVMDLSDHYGVSVYGDLVYGLYASMGMNFSTLDVDGNVQFDIGSEHSIDVMSAIIKTFNLKDCKYGTHQEAENMFLDSKSLFMYNATGYMHDKLQGTALDYTIIPCPKYNEAQKEYITCAWPNSAYCVSIPIGHGGEDLEFIGLTLEAYCHTSYEYIRPAKYERIMKYRVGLNEETFEMLDLIFDGLYFDLNLIFDFGGSRTLVAATVTSGSINRVKSYLSRIEPLIDDAVDALLNVSVKEK